MGMGGPGPMRMGPRGFLTEEEKKKKLFFLEQLL